MGSVLPSRPVCGWPQALDLMADVGRRIESPEALYEGAVAISIHQTGEENVSLVGQNILDMAEAVMRRVGSRRPNALIAHLHEMLFCNKQLGYSCCEFGDCNALSYCLPHVMSSKKGMPVVLGVLYKTIADILGIRAWGVNIPGHFMMAVWCDGVQMFIDLAQQARLLTAEEVCAVSYAATGNDLFPNGYQKAFAPLSNRQWLLCILEDLQSLFQEQHHQSDVLEMIRFKIKLAPTCRDFQDELATTIARPV